MAEIKNRFESLTLTANELRPFPGNGYSFLLLSNSVATDVKVGIGDDEPQSWPVWRRYKEPKENSRFSKIVFKNPTASPMTITFVVSLGEITVATEYGSLTSIAAILTAMAADIADLEALNEVADTPTLIVDTVVAQTGAAGTQLVTAGANNRKIFIQFDYDDTSTEGRIYLGFTSAVSATNKFAMLVPGDGHLIEGNVNVYAVSKNGTEKVWGYVIATS